MHRTYTFYSPSYPSRVAAIDLELANGRGDLRAVVESTNGLPDDQSGTKPVAG